MDRYGLKPSLVDSQYLSQTTQDFINKVYQATTNTSASLDLACGLGLGLGVCLVRSRVFKNSTLYHHHHLGHNYHLYCWVHVSLFVG